jgi:phage tail protein X
MSIPNYLTVNQFCEKHPAFKPGGIRYQIFNEKNNGLADSGVIVRMGTKVLINEEKFFAWLESDKIAPA